MSLPPSLVPSCDAILAPRLEQRILPGLERMHRVLDALGRPERSFRSVLVLGTNGKGSTAALLAAVLRAAGVRTGLYTSPHLVRVEERIDVDGAAIPADRLQAHLRTLDGHPELSYFETLTTAAILEFAEKGVDVAVLEAGLGGRWDATNAVDPTVTLLTNVGTDHQAWLGPTRAAIAAEKAAALRGREAVVGRWDDEVRPVILAGADPATPVSTVGRWASVAPLPGGRVRFESDGLAGEAALPLLGAHQHENLALALAGAAALARHAAAPALTAEALVKGIESVRWRGRLEWVEAGGRRLLLDGAHNREAVEALAAALDTLDLSGRVHLLFSCLSDKPLEAMAALLRPRAAGVAVAPVASPRATPLGALAAAFPGCTAHASVAGALDHLPLDRPVLVAGSLRLAGEVLAVLEGRRG